MNSIPICILIFYFSSREKYKDVVFVYISDDLEWGKQMIKKKAERRKINIYFVGDEKETEERSRDRNRQIKDLQSHLY